MHGLSRRRFMEVAAAGGALSFLPQQALANDATVAAAGATPPPSIASGSAGAPALTLGADRTRWFRDARFGMFIHWGLGSMTNGVWAHHHERYPASLYATLADDFNPQNFDPAAWAALAVDAGMQYAVFPARHHDGYCMFDSQASEFTSVRHAAQRDFVAEYIAAFRAAGLRIGLYYSLLDWRFPGYWERDTFPENAEALVEQAHVQVLELLSYYGDIDLLWFDGQWFADHPEWVTENPQALSEFWRSQELFEGVRSLQPDCLVNDRLALIGDFITSEQGLANATPGEAWEASMTIPDSDTWTYVEHVPSIKSVAQIVNRMTLTASIGGNLLLNVGPDPDGVIPVAERVRLQGIGQWVFFNAEGYLGTQECPLLSTTIASWTQRDNIGYLMVRHWPRGNLAMPLVGTRVVAATLLRDGTALSFRHEYNGRLVLGDLPLAPPDPYITVIRVEFESAPVPFDEPDTAAWLYAAAGSLD